MSNRLNEEVREWKLMDKWGCCNYMVGTKYEVAAYAIENQLLLVDEKEKTKPDTIFQAVYDWIKSW